MADRQRDMFPSKGDRFGVPKSAEFSDCRRYRYSLRRTWGAGPHAMVIGLNPSTADETTDDPTIRRCIRFAKDWGFDGLIVANLFAFRATDPAEMKRVAEPVGADNDRTLKELAAIAGIVVAAWGTHGTHRGRDAEVRSMLSDLHYLRLTKAGIPSHPLYLPASCRPVRWQPEPG